MKKILIVVSILAMSANAEDMCIYNMHMGTMNIEKANAHGLDYMSEVYSSIAMDYYIEAKYYCKIKSTLESIESVIKEIKDRKEFMKTFRK